MKLTILSVAVILSAFAPTVSSQTRGPKPLTSRQVRINPKDPHVVLSLVKDAQVADRFQGKSDDRVFLRIRNNSIWTIMFCSEPVPKVYGDLAVTYRIERYLGLGEIPGTGSSDACSYYLLESKKSVIFSVPRRHLAERLAIAVPFKYEWEVDPDGSDNLLEPKHSVYFYSSDLTKSTTK